MKKGKNKGNNSKLSVILTGLRSLSIIGISLFLVNQNYRILKLLKTDNQLRKFKADFSEYKNNLPLTIHRRVQTEEELPTVERRFLTG